MRIVRTVRDARAAVAELRSGICAAAASRPGCVGLVTTMGALHQGHLSLIRAARSDCGAVVATIFVNPTQFGPAEDFARYPRTFYADCTLLESEGVDLLFAPETAEMYREGASTFVDAGEISNRLDGQSRPGHFRGVATVVTKLFHIVAPDKAYFGQKDAAQVAVLRRMAGDLDFDLELVVCPTVREPDGLAMSSRNRHLSPEDRRHALALFRALRVVEERIADGILDAAPLLEAGRKLLAAEPNLRVDYLRIVDPATLEDRRDVRQGALVAVAAWVGTVRLIDNLLIPPSLDSAR